MIIGLHGKMRSGKDTVYGYIEEWAEEHGIRAERDAFADRLKTSAGRALGFKENEIEWMNDLKQDGGMVIIQIPEQHGFHINREITGREFLQYYGTEAHRDVFGSQFWVDAVFDAPRQDTDVLVLTDVRFPNEAEQIRERGGEVWQILRDDDTDDAADGHASELALDPELVDTLIINSDTLETLREMTFDLCEYRIARVASA